MADGCKGSTLHLNVSHALSPEGVEVVQLVLLTVLTDGSIQPALTCMWIYVGGEGRVGRGEWGGESGGEWGRVERGEWGRVGRESGEGRVLFILVMHGVYKVWLQDHFHIFNSFLQCATESTWNIKYMCKLHAQSSNEHLVIKKGGAGQNLLTLY